MVVLYDPSTVALVALAGASLVSGLSGMAAAQSSAAVSEVQQQAVAVDAGRAERDIRDQESTEVARIRAALAVSGGTPEAEAALVGSARGMASRERERVRQNTAYRTGILSADAKSARTSGVLSLLGGTLGTGAAFYQHRALR